MFLFKVFSKAKPLTVCAKFMMGSKFHFPELKTFFPFIDKFLQFEVMENVIIFEMRVALFYVNYPFYVKQ